MTRWLAGEPERGPAISREVRLPAGPAVELRTRIAPDTPDEWAIVLYTIDSGHGVGFLVVDGPTEMVAARETDIVDIARPIEFPEGTAACPPVTGSDSAGETTAPEG